MEKVWHIPRVVSLPGKPGETHQDPDWTEENAAGIIAELTTLLSGKPELKNFAVVTEVLTDGTLCLYLVNLVV